ncbi:unnamed protein product [Ceutorhynchus assimilis]|uniref:RETREG1-3/ARL6IP-like N-terminal reticulon-homology domain-containing protein n=1 Tax=Ceutorhynchus assimilis TaxID=467358 RepID=A0A9N9QIZ7_9CUCU|nr:unnamed protein product [Ceutorhynchus assimilis]
MYSINNTTKTGKLEGKLMATMKPYRELILLLNRVLLWDKPWYSTAILAGSSMVFTMIWLWNPNVMSIVGFMGIIATLLDFFLIPLQSFLFKRQMWTEEKQKEYQSICTNVIFYKVNAEQFMTSYYKMRVTKPKMYFTITILVLSILTWLGGTVDNIFLTYMVITFFLMMPGIQRQGWFAPIVKLFSTCGIGMRFKVEED